jgi:hypothetical protein
MTDSLAELIADGCLFTGFACIVAGVVLLMGTAWGLIAVGLGLCWCGWRLYRAPKSER